VQQNRFLYGKSFCCTAKQFPVLEVILLYCKTVSCAGSHFAVLQSRFLYWKSLCCTAKPFPVLEVILLYSILLSRPNNPTQCIGCAQQPAGCGAAIESVNQLGAAASSADPQSAFATRQFGLSF
jgi:hypothetical protein